MADALTRPSDQLTEAGQRQLARMLASITVALLVTCLVVLPAWMLLLPYYEENRPISAFMIVTMSIMYGLSRTRHYQAAAAGLVAAIVVMVALIVVTSPGDVNERIHTLYFLLIAILIANFFFHWRVVLGLVGVCLLAIAAFYLWFSMPVPLAVSFTVFFSVTIALGAVASFLNRRYQENLTKSEERYRSVVSVLSEGIVVHTADGVITACNQAACEILGLTESQLLGRDSMDPRWQAVHEDGTPFEGPDHPAMVTLRTGEVLSGVIMGVHRPTGDLRWLSITSQPLRDGTQIKGAVASFSDITERRHAEQALQRFLNDMRALQILHLELSEVSDLDTLYQKMVCLARERLGLERVGLMLLDENGQTLRGTYGTDCDGNLRNEGYYVEQVTDDHWTLPVLRAPDHVRLLQDVPLYDNAEPVATGWSAQSALWNGQRALGYLVTDNLLSGRPPRPYEAELLSILGSTFGHLIERKRNEVALITSEQRQRALLNAIPDLVLRLGADGKYIDLHAPNEADLVAAPDQIVGRHVRDLLPAAVGERILEALHRVLTTGCEEVIEYSLEIDGVWKDYEARMVAAQPDEALTIVRNVTERKNAQQREFDLALARARVRLLQQFIEKASHEFRTPLAIINSSAYLMARQDQFHSREQRAELIQRQVKRLIKMLDMLFLLSRLESITDLELAPVNLNLIVAGVCQSMESARGDKPQLIAEQQPHLPLVMAHSEYLQATLTQILDNAYNFTPPEGVIRVQVTSSEQQVCIEISDTGCGIHPDDLPHIFEVFWQHGSADSLPGLGVGLSIARRVVQLHYGQIEAHSEVGRGTTIRLILPTVDSNSALQ